MSRPGGAAVLVGNGLSIAFNPELRLGAITQAVLARLRDESDSGPEVAAAMMRIAALHDFSGSVGDDDFEVLLGAFGSEQINLSELHNLAQLVAPDDEDLAQAITRTADFATALRDVGTSHVLEVIFERSRSTADLTGELHEFVAGVTAAFGGKVYIANLNYDTLLLAALLAVCNGRLADLGDGSRPVSARIGRRTFRVPSLRTELNFPAGARVILLHLHGSLTYWRDTANDVAAKMPMVRLASGALWRQVRRGDSRFKPLVIRANQRDKAALIKEHPYALAYEGFAHQLRATNRWLIIGYSFRDVPVNDMLREQFAALSSPPEVLVVTLGSQPTVDEIRRVFGVGDAAAPWLTVVRSGVSALLATKEWAAFVDETLA